MTEAQARSLLRGDIGFLLDSGDPLFQELYSKCRGKGLRPKTIVRYDRRPFSAGPATCA